MDCDTKSDPDPAVSFARSIPIGEVIVDDAKKYNKERRLIK